MAPGLTGWAPLTSVLGAFEDTVLGAKDRGDTRPPVTEAHIFMVFTVGTYVWTEEAIVGYNAQTAIWNDRVLSNPHVAIGGAMVNAARRTSPLSWYTAVPPGGNLPQNVVETQIGHNSDAAEPGSVTGEDLVAAFQVAKGAAGGGDSINQVHLNIAIQWGTFDNWATEGGYADAYYRVYQDFMAGLVTVGSDDYGVEGYQPVTNRWVEHWPLFRDEALGYTTSTWTIMLNRAFDLHPVPVPTP